MTAALNYNVLAEPPSRGEAFCATAGRIARKTCAVMKVVAAFSVVPAWAAASMVYRAGLKPLSKAVDVLLIATWIPFVPTPLVGVGLGVKVAQLGAALFDGLKALYQEPLFMLGCQKRAILDLIHG